MKRAEAAAVVSSAVLLLASCAGEISDSELDEALLPTATHPISPLQPPTTSASATTTSVVPPMAGVGGTQSSGMSTSTASATPTWSAQPPMDSGSTEALSGPVDTSAATATSGATDTSSPEDSTSALGDLETDFTTSEASSAETEEETSTDEPTSTVEETTTGPAIVSEFNIELRFVAQVSDLVNTAFVSAVERWERVIVGDLPDIPSTDVRCGEHFLQGPVDDLVIFVEVKPIDGPQRILGAAAPCAVRRADGLPLAGLMQFDEVDLEDFARRGRLEEIVLHEMGHVLGIGSLWPNRGLLRDRSPGDNENVDTWFAGEAAIAAFDEVGGAQYSGQKVPVENIGGEGTANGHWRDSVLGTELMTSFMSGQRGELSIVTIASLMDLGYQVDMSQADEYRWPPPLRLLSQADEEPFEPIAYGDDILDIELQWVD